MSLREKSNGLLETHVTWEDIEKSLQLKYGDHIQFGPRRKAVEIGAGKGFLSKICVVEPDWPEDVTLLPSRLAVKISSELPILDLCDSPESEHQLRRVHNCELSVYEILEKYAPKNLVTPKVYGGLKFSTETQLKGFIVMEMFDDLHPNHIYDNLSV